MTRLGTHVFNECNALKTVTIDSSVIAGLESSDSLLLYHAETVYVKDGLTLGAYITDSFTISESSDKDGYVKYVLKGEDESDEPVEPSLEHDILIIKKQNSDYVVTGVKTKDFTEVTIPNFITKIGYYAFDACRQLAGITLPDSVTVIDEGGFYGCDGMTELTIGSGVNSIGTDAFSYCSGLSNITVAEGNGVYRSEGDCLIEKGSGTIILGCKNSVIPTDGSVSVIASYAFRDCIGLENISIPDNIIEIGEDVFSGCTGLVGITVSDDNSFYSSQNGILYNKDKTNIIHAPKRLSGDIVIPDSITEINNNTFYECSGISSITFGNALLSIGDYAFYRCESLGNIVIPDSMKSIGVAVFYSCYIDTITIGSGIESIGNSAFHMCHVDAVIYNGTSEEWGNITIEDGNDNLINANITFLGDDDDESDEPSLEHDILIIEKQDSDYVVTGVKTKNFSEVSIPNFVTSIGDYAFDHCSELTSITIPNSVTSVGNYAFYCCNGLASITIPDSITSIGEWAFSNCSKLTSITIPNSITNIGYNVFSHCMGLMSVNISDGITSIGGYAFFYCIGLTSITIPDSVTNIGDYAFQGCSRLTSVTIGSSINKIGNFAFSDCSGLESITVAEGNSVYHSEDNCLIETDSNTLVLGCKNSIIPTDGSVTSIGDFAFIGCSGLTSITISDSVTSIGGYGFYKCSGLTNITIPINVRNIGEYAFYYCSGLESINVAEDNIKYHSEGNCIIETATRTLILGCKNSIIPTDGSVTNIGNHAFQGCKGLTSITIPDSIKNIGWYAFEGCSSLTSIILPDNIKSIGYQAFFGCSGLTSITIPDNVTSIGDNAFCDCTELKTVIVDSSTIAELNTSNSNLLQYASTVYVKEGLEVGSYITDSFTLADSSDMEGYQMYIKK